jgi:16S rRNA processing protein RimM
VRLPDGEGGRKREGGMAKDRLIEMAVVGAAHGLKGEVRVKSFAADPMSLGGYGPLLASDGRSLTVAALRPASAGLVVRFEGVADRTAAETLNGLRLFVPRERLPAAGDADEFYHADLVGLQVRDGGGRAIGAVTGIENFGGGDLLEITHHGRRGVLIPFSPAAVPVVSVAEGFVTVDPLAAGLAEAAAPEGGPDGDAP